MFDQRLLLAIFVAMMPAAGSALPTVPVTWNGDGILEWRVHDSWGDWDEAEPRAPGGCYGPFHVAFTRGIDGEWRLEEFTGEAACPGGTPTFGSSVEAAPVYGAEALLPAPTGQSSGTVVWGDPATGFATGDQYMPWGAIETGTLDGDTPFRLVHLNTIFGTWEVLVGELAMSQCRGPAPLCG